MKFSPNKQPISIYNEWIKSILPDNIPPDIIPIDVKDNKWLYKENQNYIYDTIFDSRKTMF